MKKVLLLNGSHSELGIIQELKRMNYYVITTGNLPGSFVHEFADEYIQADYSNMERILDIARKNKVCGVVSCANDFGIITASYVTEKMGLPGYDSFQTTKLLHQKDLFKEYAIRAGLQVPYTKQFDNVDEALARKNEFDYPIIVKPSDLTGGKGVSVVDNVNDLEKAVLTAFGRSRKKTIVIEKFINGTYHSFSTFLVDQKVIGFFCDNEYSNVYRFFVDTSAGPADKYEEVQDILIGEAEKIASDLRLVNGIFHMQYVMDKYNKPYIIDICRRCSGDLYSEPVEHATGLPWTKWIIQSELGYPSDMFSERGKQSGYCGRHCIMADREGIVEDVIINEKIMKYVYKDIQWWKPGFEISNHMTDKLGILFYDFSSREEMEEIVLNVKSLVKVKLTGDMS